MQVKSTTKDGHIEVHDAHPNKILHSGQVKLNKKRPKKLLLHRPVSFGRYSVVEAKKKLGSQVNSILVTLDEQKRLINHDKFYPTKSGQRIDPELVTLPL